MILYNKTINICCSSVKKVRQKVRQHTQPHWYHYCIMSHEIFMPALSSTMTEGKIVEWLKNPGDKVERGESVLVVESDKADMDVESFQDGYLAAVLMPAGSTAPVGETIGLIVENEDEIASVQQQNKVNQSEVSTSDQLELVSNKT